MVHQHFALADNLSALDNVVLGTEPLWGWRRRRREARERLEALCRESGLAVSLDAPSRPCRSASGSGWRS
jgi:simple sugar transport system ATP-binding protein